VQRSQKPGERAGCLPENAGETPKGVQNQMEWYETGDGVETWQEVLLVYNAALRQIETKMEILNEEFQHVHQYNPIEHIKSRIKTPESIVKKLRRNGLDSTIENMVNHVNDIAGIRIICSFTSDIYRIADMIEKQRDIQVMTVKDYIMFPKASGYKSYHMIVTVPVYLSDKTVDAKVEIQIRTVAMDFWASLEHKIHYKFEGDAPEHIKQELVDCAHMVSDLDDKMLQLNEEILELSHMQEVEREEREKERRRQQELENQIRPE
jgi:putative GTP pyrophosphokinase